MKFKNELDRVFLGLTNVVVIVYMMLGSLIKMVYFSSNNHCSSDDQENRSAGESHEVSNGLGNCHLLMGRLHFVKFETRKIDDCLEFISSNQLHNHGISFLWLRKVKMEWFYKVKYKYIICKTLFSNHDVCVKWPTEISWANHFFCSNPACWI